MVNLASQFSPHLVSDLCLRLAHSPAVQEFPNRLRELRLERGLKQHHLAKALRLSVQQVSRLERGERRLSVPQLEVAAALLDVAPSQILSDGGSIQGTSALVGYLGGEGARAGMYKEDFIKPAWTEIRRVPSPVTSARGEVWAVEVRTEGLSPVWSPGDVVHFVAGHELNPAALSARWAMVGLPDGSAYLRCVRPSSGAGRYDLTFPGLPPMTGVEVAWAQPVLATEYANAQDPFPADDSAGG